MNSRAHARTNTDMEQIERIAHMERLMDGAAEAIAQLKAAISRYEAVRNDIATLDAYYGSELWINDFAADEAGRLPADLKRGVLSEDGIWNLLLDAHELDALLANTDA